MATNKNLIGSWAFLIGVIVAVIFGLFGSISGGILVLLVIIGILVGLFNIADTEVTPFLLSGVVLIIASSLGQDIMNVLPRTANVLDALLAIFVPATIIVAIKNVFALAHR